MDEAARKELGFTARRSVLGDAHVDRAIANTTDFTAEFQDLITRYAWGEIWTRPGIDHTTRRLMVLSTMIALNREEEFMMHVRAAITHGVSRDLIKEVILQAAIYCGVPAANSAFHAASRVFKELDGA
ncbi:4-carboxymuconolactone decarboxylase [Niveispirillum sp. KHB5.9]|uniref:4-carboxymuconolactone decarboxylase n=1 Tax=Niveispirillum sp. KHB5.9 TaxID=3400269 RepID=UPI003A87CDEF